MHDCENTCEGSLLYERIEQFAKHQVTKHFGLSFTEFMELPSYVCDKILLTCNATQKLENAVAENALNKIGEL